MTDGQVASADSLTPGALSDAESEAPDTIMTLPDIPDEPEEEKPSGLVKRVATSLVPSSAALIATGGIAVFVNAVGTRLPGGPGRMLELTAGEIAVLALVAFVFAIAGAIATAKTIQQRVEHRIAVWLTNYSLAFLFLLPILALMILAAIIFALTDRFWAGAFLALFGVFRIALHLANREFRPPGPVLKSQLPGPVLKSHVEASVIFHCAAIACLAIGAGLMISGLPQPDFAFPQRAALIATVLLASAIAINKATSRGRKVCTQIFEAIESVERAFTRLRQAGPEKKAEVREQFIAELAPLDRALRTRLNSGYPGLGSFIVQSEERGHLVDDLLALADGAGNGSTAGSQADGAGNGKVPVKWDDLKSELRKLAEACEPWVDVSA
ncbi:hypothetical protein ACFYXF_36680 [Streptomyces sp. NPDC002680]|uniref:hypothetical protein n=1 Tax=Streptomyces sp. NPDC002680 TaxID=3364659 RepID=UPI0036CD08E4